MLRLVAPLGLVLAGCAAPVGGVAPDARSAPPTPLVVSATPLADAPSPDLPAPLRPSPADGAAMDHGAMGHDAMTPRMAARPDQASIRPVLDAYLAVHDALVADVYDAAAAAALTDAVVAWTGTPPAADPHLWHRHADAVDALRQSAGTLAEAASVEAARAAFGALSVPFATLVEATGVPTGYDLARFTCGMADAPEGGVWLQPAGDAQNPYFGTSMAMCGTRDHAVPTATDAATMEHEGMGTHR